MGAGSWLQFWAGNADPGQWSLIGCPGPTLPLPLLQGMQQWSWHR